MNTKNTPFGIVIHGGAGTILKANMSPEKEKAYKLKLQEALNVGYTVLDTGGSSVDAVEAAIKVMEDSPLFNAGKGAVFTHEGTNEMDASIMEGKELNAGAVAGVRTVKNPISAARKVMENSPHVMLSGTGADKFAEEEGLDIADTSYFFEENRWKQLQKIHDSEKQQLDHSSDDEKGYLPEMDEDELNKKFGTVGAVALDKYGNLAGGTSTGGMTNKRFGRIGDSPIIGAGTYANNNTCAISSTGHGEYFIRALAAYDISALMEYKNLSIQEAADQVVMKKLVNMGGNGGIIGIDSRGNMALVFNTTGMYRAFKSSNGESGVAIYR